MRAIVFSDSHGNYDVLETIVERHREDADLFIHLGDGEREMEYIRYAYPEKKFLFVAGNCDYGSEAPDYDVADFGGKKIFLTHGWRFGVKGSLDPIKEEARKFGADILLFGHTHIAETDYDEGLYVMNPGSCARPREGGPSYGIIDVTKAGIAFHIVHL